MLTCSSHCDDISVFYDAIDRGRAGRNVGLGIGLPKLSEFTGGLTRGTFTLLFAGTGIGKSSFALYSYVYRPLLSGHRIRIIYFALEMASIYIYAKLLSTYIYERYGYVLEVSDIFSLRSGHILDDRSYGLLQESRDWLDGISDSLHIYAGSMSSDGLYAVIIKELESLGSFSGTEYTVSDDRLVLVIVDHAGLLIASHGRSRKEEIDRGSKMMVSLRNRYNVSCLWIMQVNRAIASMERKRLGYAEPLLEDIKDSGCPGEDAEIVLSLYNPARDHLKSYRGYDLGSYGNRFRSILCLKSRYGRSDAIDFCEFNGSVNIWKELNE